MHRSDTPHVREAVKPRSRGITGRSPTPESSPASIDVLPREQLRQMLAEAASRQVFDTEGAAEYLGVSRQLLELMRVAGGGPRYAKLGRLVRYRLPALDTWLIERERCHTAKETVR